MALRIAFARTDAEREAIYRLRYDVYVRDMHMFGDVADHSGGRLLDDHDVTGRLIFAETGGEIVGTVRLNWGGDAPFSEEHRVTYGLEPFLGVVDSSRLMVATRMIVRATHRGTPLPLALWRASAEFGRAHDTTLAFCDCQPHLISFYQLAGFRPYRVAYNDPHFGIMIPLVLVGPDTEYLERVRSPLADALRGWPGDISKLDRLKTLIPDAPPVRSALPSIDGLATRLRALLGSREDGGVGFFQDIDEAEFRRLLERGHVIECARGDFVIRRGQILRTIFVVLEGELEAQRDGVSINVVRPGECFGEIAFLQGLPRTVDVVANTPRVVLLSLNEGIVQSLIARDPDIAAKLILNMARGLALKLARRDAARADTEWAVHD